MNRRMHNKALIADNQGTILGGRNIGDEYFGASSDGRVRRSRRAGARPIVARVSTAFDEYWNSEAAYPIERLLGRQADRRRSPRCRAELER